MANLDYNNNIKSPQVLKTEEDRNISTPSWSGEDLRNMFKEYNKSVSNTPISNATMDSNSWGKNLGNYFTNDSQYDSTMSQHDILNGNRSIEDLRASRQPWYDQLANNLVNMSTIAGTTFADSFIGTAAGLVNMIYEGTKDYKGNLSLAERLGDAFVENPVSVELNAINDKVKQALPTYKSDEYMQNQADGNWHKNIFSTQFLGETLMENAGFTLGMVASGKVSGSLLGKVSKLGQQSDIVRKGVATAIQEGRIANATAADIEKITRQVLNGKRSLSTLNLGLEAEKAVKNINQISTINNQIATAISVSGEARQEGVNSSKEFREKGYANIESLPFQQDLMKRTIMEMYNDPNNKGIFKYKPTEDNYLDSIDPYYLNRVDEKYEQNLEIAKQGVEDGASRVAGLDFALNFPILYGSTMWQFGRTFSKGYDTQKGFMNNIRNIIGKGSAETAIEGSENIVREGGKYVLKNGLGNKIAKGLKLASNPLVEANEEMMQAAAQTASEYISGAKMNEEVRDQLSGGNESNSFYSYKVNPEYEQEQIGTLAGIWNGIKDTYTDWDKYQEGLAGFLMGGMGSVNFTFSKNNTRSSGNGIVDTMSNIFDGGIFNEVREEMANTRELQEVTEALNNRLESPEFINYYQGLIRHNSLEQNKQESLESDNKFSFLNNDHAQLISDVMMFEKAGKIQDLYDNLDSNIEKYSTTDRDQITEIATELRELSRDQETGVDMLSDKTDNQIVEESLKFNKELKDNVDNYRKISSNLKSLIGDKFTEDNAFQEMVYMFSQIDNFEKRYDTLNKELVETLTNIKNSEINNKLFTINLDNSEKTLTLAEIIQQSTPSELNQFLVGKIQDESSEFDILRTVLSPVKNNIVEAMLYEKSNQDILDNKNKRGENTNQQEIEVGKNNNIIKEIHKALTQTKEKEVILSTLNDLIQIEDARAKLTNTYNRYVGHPQELLFHLEEEEIKAAEEQDNIVHKTVKDELKEAKSIEDIKGIISREVQDKGNTSMDRIISEMSISDNKDFSPLIADYRQMENLSNEINESNIGNQLSEDTRKGVNQLFNIIKDRSSNFQELTNPTITQDDLDQLGDRNINYPQDVREDFRDKLLSILDEIKTRNSKYTNLEGNLKPNPNQSKDDNPKNMPTDEVIGNISNSEAKKEDAEIKKVLDEKNNPIISTDKIWNNGVWEIEYNTYKATGQLVDRNDPLYKPASDYLKANGAFDYINSGKLSKGDTIYFIAHQEYWDQLIKLGANADWVNANKPLLLITESKEGTIESNGKKYQIVGTFDSKLNPILHNKVLESNKENTNSKDKILLQDNEGVQILEQPVDNMGVLAPLIASENLQTAYIVYNPKTGQYSRQFKDKDSAIEYHKKAYGNTLIEQESKKEDNSISIDTSLSTTVTNITPGRVEFNTEKSVNSLQGKTPNGEDIEMLFGIVDNTGQVTTNLDNTTYSIYNVTPTNSEYSNSGRLYLLTKSASQGNYIPTAVRVKNLSEVDYTLDTPLFKELNSSIYNLARASLSKNPELVADSVHTLRNFLYVGSKAGLSIKLENISQGGITNYNLVFKKGDDTIEVVNVGNTSMQEVDSNKFSDNGFTEVSNFNSDADIANNIFRALANLKAPFQINKNNINGKWNVKQSLGYNDVLLAADILTTNLSNNYVRGAYFTMNPIDSSMKEIKGSSSIVQSRNANPTAETVLKAPESSIEGKMIPLNHFKYSGIYTLNNKGQVFDNTGKQVTDVKITTAVKVKSYLKGKTSEELKDITFKGGELFPGSMLSGDIYFVLPDGKIWNSTNFSFVEPGGQVHTRINEQIEERTNPKDQTDLLEDSEELGEVIEEFDLFSPDKKENKEEKPAEKRRQRVPSKGRISDDFNLSTKDQNMSPQEIQDKIDENKDYQKDNCNGIKPI